MPDDAPADIARFPALRARTLGGRDLDLPADFRGPSVLLLAFAPSHQAVAESWLPQLDALRSRHPSLRTYGMPVLPAGARLLRGLVTGALRTRTTDAAARDAIVPLYTDVAALQAALGLPDRTRHWMVLLDGGGRVLERAAGAWERAAWDALEAALALHLRARA